MVKGAVVGLINNAALSQQSSSYDDGRAITLISTDTDGVVQSATMFHESWAHIVEVVTGMTMLARQVGWVSPVPLVIIFCESPLVRLNFSLQQIVDRCLCQVCSRMSRYLAQNLQSKQKDWNAATQERIAMTTSALSSIKGMKMLGFATETESLIQGLRARELDMGNKVRWMMVAYNASGM